VRIDDFIWKPQFVDKLEQKHGATTDEVEEVFVNRPRFCFVEAGERKGEDVYSAMGQTHAGRYLVVYVILKPEHKALVVSACDMDRKERRMYAKK
jgi:hypothetical protein